MCRPDTVVDPEDLHAQASIWHNLSILGVTISQEMIEFARGDHQSLTSPVEDFLRHLISNLNKATPEEKPRQTLLYAILYASLPLRSIGSTLEERSDTQSNTYGLYKKLLSIIQEYMKRPIDMRDSELAVSIDAILDQTGDPFDVLAFITQVSRQASRNRVVSPNLRRAFKFNNHNSDPNYSLNQVDTSPTVFGHEHQALSSNNQDIEQGISLNDPCSNARPTSIL